MNDKEYDQPLNQASEEIQYSVTLWEIILIMMGAIMVIGTALLGLGFKALNNAFDPIRAEAIAKSMIDYKFPTPSQGLFGLNIGGAQYAWVRSTSEPPDVVLFIGRVSVDEKTDRWEIIDNFERTPAMEIDGGFITHSTEIQSRQVCGKLVDVTLKKGEQVFKNFSFPLPAFRYVFKLPDDLKGKKEKFIILTTNGKSAQSKGEEIFKSLRCNPNK